MAHTVGDIVQVSWVQDCLEQRFLNIQHYRVTSSSSSNSDTADSQSFADHLAALTGGAELIGIWKAEMSEDWILRDVRAQKVDPTRSAYAEAAINAQGLDAGPADVQNAAVVVTKRGTSGTRKGIGGVHFGGFRPTKFSQGNISAATETWWGNMEPLYTASQTVAANGVIYAPVIYNPGSTPNYQTVFSWTLQDTVRVMRRRTLRVGV